MDLLQQFQQQLKSYTQLSINDSVFLLAVSGGVDSVVLTDLCYKSQLNFFIAHCNFQLRGDESERDEQFVRSMAGKYGIEVFVKRFATEEYAGDTKVSIQVAARELRYEWFREVIRETIDNRDKTQHTARHGFIVTAHHADDNIETVVMNFFRGTGLKGLRGMDVFYEGIFRPLLSFKKHELLAYARENQLEYVEDSSNANSYYTRNYFRNELLPAVSKVFPAAEDNILKNIQRLKEVEQVYNNAMQHYKNRIVEQRDHEEHLPILKLQKLSAFRTVLWEIIKVKGFSSAQVNEVIKLMSAENASYIDSSTHRIIKNRKWLIITPRQSKQDEYIVIERHDRKTAFTLGALKIEPSIPASSFSISSAKNIAAFDESTIEFPLMLRRWKQGDYFYPLGMRKKKKLSRFFIDEKLSPTEKENVWVLEMNKKIIWIINHRIDDRVKITPSTSQVLKIAFESNS